MSSMRGMFRSATLAAVAVVLLVAVSCVPPTPPVGPSGAVIIEGGRAVINHSVVSLSFVVSSDVTEMRIANGADPSGASWEPYLESASWVLSPGDGNRQVSVQFRNAAGDVSDVGTASVIVDTVPPELTIASPLSGSTIDLATGEWWSLVGSASDDRGEVLVTVETQGQSVGVRSFGEQWVRPIGAPSSGTYTYVATATDLALNATTESVDLVVLVPPPDAVVVRAGVLVLDAPLRAAVRSVDPVTGMVDFAGDLTDRFEGVRLIASEPLPGIAELGLARRVKSVVFDPAAGMTRVESTQAGIFDFYAQLPEMPPAPAVAATEQSAASAADSQNYEECSSFVDGKDVHFESELYRGTIESPTDTLPAELTSGLDMAAYLDVDLPNIGFEWWGEPKITDFGVSFGVLFCADDVLQVEGELQELVEQLVGAELWGSGLAQCSLWPDLPSSLKPCPEALLDLANSEMTDAEVGISLDLLEAFTDTLKVPLAPLPITLGLTLGPSAFVGWDATSGSSVRGETSFGFEAGVHWDTVYSALGGPQIPDDVHFDPTGSADASVSTTGPSKAYRGLGVGVGLGLNTLGVGLGGDIVSMDVQNSVEGIPSWNNGLVGEGRSLEELRVKACTDLNFDIGSGVDLEIGVPNTPVEFTLQLIDWELFHVDAWENCPYDRTWRVEDEAPLEITTEFLPGATALVPYTSTLRAYPDELDKTWELVSGSLPPGITLDPDGTIAGQATAVGSWPIDVKVTDAFQRNSTKSFELDVGLGATFGVATTSLTAQAGEPFEGQLETTPTVQDGVAWEIVGGEALPSGLALLDDGRIVGTPTTLEDRSIVVQASFDGQTTDPTEVIVSVVGCADPVGLDGTGGGWVWFQTGCGTFAAGPTPGSLIADFLPWRSIPPPAPGYAPGVYSPDQPRATEGDHYGWFSWRRFVPTWWYGAPTSGAWVRDTYDREYVSSDPDVEIDPAAALVSRTMQSSDGRYLGELRDSTSDPAEYGTFVGGTVFDLETGSATPISTAALDALNSQVALGRIVGPERVTFLWSSLGFAPGFWLTSDASKVVYRPSQNEDPSAFGQHFSLESVDLSSGSSDELTVSAPVVFPDVPPGPGEELRVDGSICGNSVSRGAPLLSGSSLDAGVIVPCVHLEATYLVDESGSGVTALGGAVTSGLYSLGTSQFTQLHETTACEVVEPGCDPFFAPGLPAEILLPLTIDPTGTQVLFAEVDPFAGFDPPSVLRRVSLDGSGAGGTIAMTESSAILIRAYQSGRGPSMWMTTEAHQQVLDLSFDDPHPVVAGGGNGGDTSWTGG